jgi:hypothetical protein
MKQINVSENKMKKVIAEFLVDDEKLIGGYNEMYGIDNFHDAINGEFGVMKEYGIQCVGWKVDQEVTK